MRISLSNLGGTPVLAGAVRGQQLYLRLVEKLFAEPAGPEVLFLDFDAVEVATASFLRESVLAIRDYVRDKKPMLYPVVANANDAVREELLEVLKFRREVIMSCLLDETGRVTRPAPIGEMEPKQQLTFDLVHSYGETDAAELMRDHGDTEGTKHTTAWNNRLASLAVLGLVIEESRGRAKRYRPLFEGA